MAGGERRVRIIWTKPAREDLGSIIDFLASDQGVPVTIVRRIVNSIFQRTRRLETFPKSGEVEPNLAELDRDHRHLVQGNYKIIYRVEKETVFIVSVFDTRQDPQKLIRRIKKSDQE